jgi:hypothetical protein
MFAHGQEFGIFSGIKPWQRLQTASHERFAKKKKRNQNWCAWQTVDFHRSEMQLLEADY